MILPVAINDIISRIEGIHKIPSVGKKSFGRTYGIEIIFKGNSFPPQTKHDDPTPTPIPDTK